ncbi:MAG: 4Fe-4S cluster-binding domain-containing protein [Bacilli bacterium]|nr:4Fe-4S cluster-binding domain-containing protein [Bacilli bacterium]
MNIIATQFTMKYGSFEIAVSGCKGKNGIHCKGCHSPETWDFNLGEEWKTYEGRISQKIKRFSNLIKWIWVYGGEPNDNNPKELEELLTFLKSFDLPIVLFTSYDFNAVPAFEKELCDYIKCGEYIEELRTEDNIQYGIQLATSNQKIYKKGVDY